MEEENLYIDGDWISLISRTRFIEEIYPQYAPDSYVYRGLSRISLDEYILSKDKKTIVQCLAKQKYMHYFNTTTHHLLLVALYDNIEDVFQERVSFRRCRGTGGLKEMLTQGAVLITSVQRYKKMNRFGLPAWRMAMAEAYKKNPICGGRLWIATDSHVVTPYEPFILVFTSWSWKTWYMAAVRGKVFTAIADAIRNCLAYDDNSDCKWVGGNVSHVGFPRLLSIRLPRLVAAMYVKGQHMARARSTLISLMMKCASQLTWEETPPWLTASTEETLKYMYHPVYLDICGHFFLGLYKPKDEYILVLHPFALQRSVKLGYVHPSLWPHSPWRKAFSSPKFLEFVLSALELTHEQVTAFDNLLIEDKVALEDMLMLKFLV